MFSLVTSLAGVACIAFLATLIVCIFIISKANKLGLIDKPNSRSSHTLPTPRGGGISLALAALFSIPFYYPAGSTMGGEILFIAVPIAISLIGLLDDLTSLSAKKRLIAQFILASALVSYGLYFVNPGAMLLSILLPVTFLFFVLFIVWMTNLFNFMDGLDGISGVQGLLAGLFFASIYQGDSLAFLFSGTLVVFCFSFLLFNWSPAKIFMGDAGSCFLGSGFAALAFFGYVHNHFSFIFGAFCVGPFIVDATYTLFRRYFDGQKITVAHRSHLYQKLANDYGFKATTVCFIYISLNIFLFYPAAYLVKDMSWGWQLFAFALASLPLVLLSRTYRAGLPGTVRP